MTKVKHVNANEIALKAAEIIETRGLHKGGYGTVGGPVCLRGAINEVVSGHPAIPADDDNLYEQQLRLADKLFWATHLCGISTWNDKPERTKEDVVNMLRSVAETL